MSYQRVPDNLLDKFVSKKYHWQTLNPDQQQSMAVELIKHRFMEQEYLQFIDLVLEDKQCCRRYRELVGGNQNDNIR